MTAVSKALGSAWKRLLELKEDVRQARRNELQVDQEMQEFEYRRLELKEQLADAYADGRGMRKVEAELKSVLGQRRDHVPKLEGARRRRARAEAAVQGYIGSHFCELLEELRPACTQASVDVQRAIDWMSESKARWDSCSQTVDELIQQTPGIRSNPKYQMPVLRLGQLQSYLAAVDGDVPVPIPRQLLEPDVETQALLDWRLKPLEELDREELKPFAAHHQLDIEIAKTDKADVIRERIERALAIEEVEDEEQSPSSVGA
jgi:hypothetical protein